MVLVVSSSWTISGDLRMWMPGDAVVLSYKICANTNDINKKTAPLKVLNPLHNRMLMQFERCRFVALLSMLRELE